MKKRMTLEQFLKRLRKFKGRFRITADSCIRMGSTCPVVAVAGAKGDDYNGWGASLGLAYETARRIADASDYEFEQPALRKRILKAVGLQ